MRAPAPARRRSRRTASGRRTFDITGIPPTVATPVFTDEEFEAHRDSALTEARALLGGDRGLTD